VEEKIKSSQEMSLALSGVLAIGEAYPELKANQNFINLQSRVSSLETTLSDRRETYNEVVTNFNTRLEQFPDVLAARILGYQEQMLFKVDEAEKIKPSLKMDLPKF
jgi:LemA protein